MRAGRADVSLHNCISMSELGSLIFFDLPKRDILTSNDACLRRHELTEAQSRSMVSKNVGVPHVSYILFLALLAMCSDYADTDYCCT